jgi:hypothetical protein
MLVFLAYILPLLQGHPLSRHGGTGQGKPRPYKAGTSKIPVPSPSRSIAVGYHMAMDLSRSFVV